MKDPRPRKAGGFITGLALAHFKIIVAHFCGMCYNV